MNKPAVVSRTRFGSQTNRMWGLAIMAVLATVLALAASLSVHAQDNDKPNLDSLSVTDPDGAAIDIGAFDPAVTSYSADVAGTVESVTIDAAASKVASWHTRILPGDSQPDVSGHQIDLSHGANLIVISLHRYSGEDLLRTYSVEINRAGEAPENAATTVSISGVYVAKEGSTIPFLLTRTGDTTQALTVPVDVAETSTNFLPFSSRPEERIDEDRIDVEFQAGYASARLDLETDADSLYLGGTRLEVVLVGGVGYEVEFSARGAYASVWDDDYESLNLAGLAVTDQNGAAVNIGTFDPAVRSYSGSVDSSVEHITIIATPPLARIHRRAWWERWNGTRG